MHNPNESSSLRKVIQEENTSLVRSRLSWSPIESDIILSGETQINTLKNIRNTVLSIRRQFQTNTDPKIHLNPLNRDDFNKRMMLLQGQVQGLMRRKINFTSTGEQGYRSLDYTNLLSQKENQIVQLEKKIQNLEFQLRKTSAREMQLQNHIIYLNDQLRVKDQIIGGKNDVILAEVANSNSIKDALNKIRRNVDMNKHKIQDLDRIVFSEVNIPDIGSFEIKAEALTRNGSLSRSRSYQQLSQSQQSKIRIVQMFREVERIISQNGDITQIQFDRILEGFILVQKQSRIFEKSMIAAKRNDIEEKYQKLRQNFAIAAGIYQENIEKLKKDNPSIRVNLEKNLFQILQRQNVKAYQVDNGAIFIDAYTEKTVQVPVQDGKTKYLIHLLTRHMKTFTTKYPQLLKQMDKELCQYFQQQIIQMIQVDQMDKLVNIVKYVPQVVRVENVYAYSSEKTRKVQFHLRVLIKALLQEVQKMKAKTGVTLQMDEGVLGMISAEIMGVVNVDDILKVFRPVPKIVQVQRVVQKIVERRVQVPIVIPIIKEIEKIVQVDKIVQVQKFINVPLQIPTIQTQIVEKIVQVEQIIEKVIEVPTIVERIVYVTQQVIKIVQVPTFVEKIVQVEKVVQVERVFNHVQQIPEQIQVIREKIVPVQTIVQRIVQVAVIRQKIVQRIVQVPTVQIIERIVEKAVPIIQYRKALQVINHIQTIYKPVDRIVQRIVPVYRTVERIVEVPQVIEKIVQVIVQKIELRQVQVVREKLVRQQVIKQIQVIVKEIVEVIREVPVEVERIVEVPVIHQVIKIVKVIVEKPIIERVQSTVIKEVYLRDPMIVYQPKIVQVQRVVNHYIQVPKPIRYIEQRIIQIPRNVQRIKQVRVQIDKIIQKLVQVPKVIQVERIVEKIVIVPRVIQKIIQVPQIVEKLVLRQVEKIVVREIQIRVQIPVIQEKIVEVEIIKNVYIEVEKPVDRIVDKLVTVNNVQERVVTHEVKVENAIQVIRQVPKTLHVDKIVSALHEKIKAIQIQRTIIVPHEIAVPVQVVRQKLIPVRQIVQKIIQVPQFIQKIIEKKQQSVRVQYIQKIIEKIVVDQRIKQVQRIVPYIQQVIKQIPTIVQKIVTIQSKVQQIITAQQIVQKIVQRSTTIPRIYEVEKVVSKLIKVPQIIEVEKIIPQIIRVNQYIQKIVERVVEVPRIIERIKEIQVQREKLVQVTHTKNQIVEVERVVEKIAILEQMKEVIKNVNHIERVVRIVQQIQRSTVEVTLKEQILVQIPYILEKIVEKIVIMPQIVQVLKYVHQISQSNDLLTVEDQLQFKGQQLKLIQLTKNMKPSLDSLIRELRGLKNVGQVSDKVQIIQGFLLELQKLIAFPKLIRIKQKQRLSPQVIQKQTIVRVPVQDQQHLRKQISMSILIEKLIMQIKRITLKGNIALQLDDQIKMIFFAELQTANRYSLQGQLKDKFNRFAMEINRKFETLGPWAQQSQLMLNTILEERFKLAQIIESANVQIQRSRLEYQNVAILLTQQSKANKNCREMLNRLKGVYGAYSAEKKSQLAQIKIIIQDVESQHAQQSQMIQRQVAQSMTRLMGQQEGMSETYESKLREKEATISKLKDSIHKMQKTVSGQSSMSRHNQESVINLQRQVQQLRKGKSTYDSKADLSRLQQSYRKDISSVQQRNETLERQNSLLRNSLDNSNRQLRTLHQNQKFLMRRDEKHRVDESSWVRESSHQFTPGSLSHSQIKRQQGSYLSQSQYSIYEGKTQDYRQSPSKLLQGVQLKQSQQAGLMTPLQAHKYRSPLSTELKYTQSFFKDQSRSMTGQSPQGHTIFTTPGSIKYQKEKESQEKRQDQSGVTKQYKSYYSPEQKGNQ